MRKTLHIFSAVFAFAFLGIIFAIAPMVYATTDTIPPSIPTGISSSITSSNQIYVSWNSSSDNVGVVGYYLYRNGQFIANTPGYTYYTDEPGGGVFSYTVAAYDAAGNVSAQSSPTTPLTLALDTTPPTAPTNLTATPTASSIALSWSASSDNNAVIGYYVYRNGVQITTPTPITGTSYTDSGLPPGVTYRYTVTAYDAAGNISDAASIMATTILDNSPPSIPTGLQLVAISPTQVNLTWQSSTDNMEVSGYDIYRNGVNIGTSPTPSYTDTSVSPTTLYFYAVDAYDEVGNVSRQGNLAYITTPSPDTTPPSKVTNLIVNAVSGSEVDLSWNKSTDNIGVVGYDIYRNGAQIASTASTTYIDTDPTLATSTAYYYSVTAYDAAGNVSPQTSVGVLTPAYETAPPTSSSIANNSSTSSPTSTAPTPQPMPFIPTTSSVSTTPVLTPPSTPPTPIFTSNLYLGLRGTNITDLQNLLIQINDLGSSYATGYYGLLTQKAVQKFQCANNIICSGSPRTTGWGFVGPKTRNALNALEVQPGNSSN